MADQRDIPAYRKEIDHIDTELLRLLNERSKNVIEIGKSKKRSDTDAQFHTPRREAEIIDRLMQEMRGRFRMKRSGRSTAKSCRPRCRSKVHRKLPTLDLKATFTHLACIQKFGNSAQYLPTNSIKEVFNEVNVNGPISALSPSKIRPKVWSTIRSICSLTRTS